MMSLISPSLLTNFERRLMQSIQFNLVLSVFLFCSLTACESVFSQIERTSAKGERAVGYLNIKSSTSGGQQFWTDYVYRGGWRIQKNSETGHFRLLDPSDVRHAWGNLRHCKDKLIDQMDGGKVLPEKGPLVILLHGLIRTSDSMQPLEVYLQRQGFRTLNFRYASSRHGIGTHAAALQSVIDHLDEGVTDIYFVAHSLGNIVIRRYFADASPTVSGSRGDARIRRIVMLGPPNQGSKVAKLMRASLLFNTIAGISGNQLGAKWEETERQLCEPPVDFAIIAGGQANDRDWSNFVLEGKDDFTVSVEEAKLVGARDMVVWPLLHGTMMKQKDVMRAVDCFFRHGYLVSEATRKPVSASK